ncbi:hypothetical protein [Persephonella sp.]
MREFLKDIYPEISYKRGDVFVVNVLSLFEKSKFLLSGKKSNTSPKKSRPIVILKTKSENCEFFALSTDFLHRRKRPKFPIHECEIKEENCFGLKLKKSKYNLIFGKKTATKKLRVIFEINVHLLNEMEDEGNLVFCGRCSQKVLNLAESLINEFISEVK